MPPAIFVDPGFEAVWHPGIGRVIYGIAHRAGRQRHRSWLGGFAKIWPIVNRFTFALHRGLLNFSPPGILRTQRRRTYDISSPTALFVSLARSTSPAKGNFRLEAATKWLETFSGARS
jgi:hypothetical protein